MPTDLAQNSSIVTWVRPSGMGPPTVVDGSPLRTKKSLMNGIGDPTNVGDTVNVMRVVIVFYREEGMKE